MAADLRLCMNVVGCVNLPLDVGHYVIDWVACVVLVVVFSSLIHAIVLVPTT